MIIIEFNFEYTVHTLTETHRHTLHFAHTAESKLQLVSTLSTFNILHIY